MANKRHYLQKCYPSFLANNDTSFYQKDVNHIVKVTITKDKELGLPPIRLWKSRSM